MYGTEVFNITSFEVNKLHPKLMAISCDGFFLSKISKIKLSFFQIEKTMRELTSWEYVAYKDLKNISLSNLQVNLDTEDVTK